MADWDSSLRVGWRILRKVKEEEMSRRGCGLLGFVNSRILDQILSRAGQDSVCMLETPLWLLCGGWVAKGSPGNRETRVETGREGCMTGVWPRRRAVAVKRRRWVPEILRKGTNNT